MIDKKEMEWMGVYNGVIGLVKEIADLKNGVCEHVAQNVFAPDCRLCELSLKEKRLDIVEKEIKELKETLRSRSTKIREVLDEAMLLLKRYALCDENFDKIKSIEKAIADAESDDRVKGED